MAKRFILAIFISLLAISSASAQGGFIGFNCGHGGFGTPAFGTVGGTGFTQVYSPVVGGTGFSPGFGGTAFTPVFTPVIAAPTTVTTNGTGFTPVTVSSGQFTFTPVTAAAPTADTPVMVLQFKPPVLPGGQTPPTSKDPAPGTAGLNEINETLKRIEGHLKKIAAKGGGEEEANTTAARRPVPAATRQRAEPERKPAAPTLADRLKEADRVIATLSARK